MYEIDLVFWRLANLNTVFRGRA